MHDTNGDLLQNATQDPGSEPSQASGDGFRGCNKLTWITYAEISATNEWSVSLRQQRPPKRCSRGDPPARLQPASRFAEKASFIASQEGQPVRNQLPL